MVYNSDVHQKSFLHASSLFRIQGLLEKGNIPEHRRVEACTPPSALGLYPRES